MHDFLPGDSVSGIGRCTCCTPMERNHEYKGFVVSLCGPREVRLSIYRHKPRGIIYNEVIYIDLPKIRARTFRAVLSETIMTGCA